MRLFGKIDNEVNRFDRVHLWGLIFDLAFGIPGQYCAKIVNQVLLGSDVSLKVLLANEVENEVLLASGVSSEVLLDSEIGNENLLDADVERSVCD